MRNSLCTPRLREQRPHGSESIQQYKLTSSCLQKSELYCCQECLVAQSDVEICHFLPVQGEEFVSKCATTLLAVCAVDLMLFSDSRLNESSCDLTSTVV